MTFSLALLALLTLGAPGQDARFARLGETAITTVSPDCAELLGYDVSPLGDQVLYVGRLKNDTGHVAVWLNRARIGPASDSVPEYGFTSAGRPYGCLVRDGRWQVMFDRALSKWFDEVLLDSAAGTRFVSGPSGDRIACLARDGVWMTAVVNTKPGGLYTTVTDPLFGPRDEFYHLAQKGNAWLLVTNGREGKPYESITDLALMPRSAAPLFIAIEKNHSFLVCGGQEGRRWPQILEVTFTPQDSVPAYVACDSTQWYIVEDTLVRTTELGILVHSLRYRSQTREPVYVVIDAGFRSRLKTDGRALSDAHMNIEHISPVPDGRHVIFQTADSNTHQVWLDHNDLKVPTGISGPVVFSPDSRRYAFVTASDSGERVVSDRGETRLFDRVSELQFTPDSGQMVFAARLAGTGFVVREDREGQRYDAVAYLKFSPVTRRLAYLAVKDDLTQEVVDDVPGVAYDDIGPVQFKSDGTRIAYPARRGNDFFWVCRAIDDSR
jgi:hypothetical protein